MNNPFKNSIVLVYNIIWFSSCILSYFRFKLCSYYPRITQMNILLKILRENKKTQWFRDQNLTSIRGAEYFTSIKPADYGAFEPYIQKIRQGEKNVLTNQNVILLEPTSGSTSAPKLIPYTFLLQKQFISAINPWIASMFLQCPALFLGKHYWSISPMTKYPHNTNDVVPVGFASDADYLGTMKWVIKKLIPVPSQISEVENSDDFEYCTLLFLVREKNLRSISVWHPSFLNLLIKKLLYVFPMIVEDIKNGTLSIPGNSDNALIFLQKYHCRPDYLRAQELSGVNITRCNDLHCIWPHLSLISSWTGNTAQSEIDYIKKMFPRTVIQPKGLIATEGIISFPVGKHHKHVCAIRSHFLEFIEENTESIVPVWKLEINKRYSVVITTVGGLYRYKLHDVVEVTGFYNAVPCITFVGKDNVISDLVGEKLSLIQVGEIVNQAKKKYKTIQFALIAPDIDEQTYQYILFVQFSELKPGIVNDLSLFMEENLKTNFHYHHARNLKQLLPLRIFIINEDAERRYIEYCVRKGQKRGDIKIQALHKETNWREVFKGTLV